MKLSDSSRFNPTNALRALAALGLVVAGAVLAADPDERREELARIQERLKSAQQSRQELGAKRGKVEEELAELERNNGRLLREINQLEADARAQGQRLAELEKRRTTLMAGMQSQQRALAGQARSAYATGRREWLKLMLNQEDPSRLTRVLAYYSYLNQARSALLQGMEQDLAAARQVQEGLAIESERLGATRQRMAAERAELDESRRTRRRLLAELENELRDQDAELRRLRDNEQRLQDLLASIQLSGTNGTPTESAPLTPSPLSTPEASSKCPIAGRLVGQFGSPRMSGKWDGILIAAEEGAPVRAVSKGRVAFSDWLRGYGLLAIVDHGDGVMSLYGFNQSLYKSVGEPVEAGEVIAVAGASDGRSEPGLYFGIRNQGRAVDPTPWCK